MGTNAEWITLFYSSFTIFMIIYGSFIPKLYLNYFKYNKHKIYLILYGVVLCVFYTFKLSMPNEWVARYPKDIIVIMFLFSLIPFPLVMKNYLQNKRTYLYTIYFIIINVLFISILY